MSDQSSGFDFSVLGSVPHLGSALLLLHSQDCRLWAGGHTFLWLLKGRSQAHIAADETDHVVDEGVDTQGAVQVYVRLLVGVC